MPGEVHFTGPEPPHGQRLCGWHAAIAKGTAADQRKSEIESLPDGDELYVDVIEDIPVAVAQTLVLLPLPPVAASIPGMPQSLPILMDVCWDCLNGLTVLKSNLAIAGPGVRVTG